jgi:O-antigen ligase
MIRGLTYALALLYCFVWLRIPDLAGVALPIQRLVAWAALAVILILIATKGSLLVGTSGRSFLKYTGLFLAFMLVNLVQKLAYGTNFYPLYFAMDFSKYVAIFLVAFVTYYALTTRLVNEDGFARAILFSGVCSTLLVYVFLSLYFLGFRTENELLAPSFGGALGVWPTAGILPRLAGTAAEPQQLSVLLLTPLLLMLSPVHLHRYWHIAGLGLLAMLLSQSKFAVVSLAFVALYLAIVYRRRWKLILAGLVLITPVLVMFVARLPTFAETLRQGTSAGAFVERLENLVLLVNVFRENPLLGIGPGQYGVFRGITLFGDASYSPTYYPNMDFLKILAEVGIIGFLIVVALLASLVRLVSRGYRRITPDRRDRYLAFFLGALAILCNMLIGYELLHVFFWINMGMLMYLAEISSRTAAADALR